MRVDSYKSEEKIIVDNIRKMSDNDLELYIYSLRKMAEQKVESNISFLTGLYNLRAFQYKGADEMVYNPDLKFAVIVMDFSRFMFINEFCGRSVGDEVLLCAADAFKSEIKAHVVVSHFRADIFGMLTPYETEEDLIKIVERIDNKISKLHIPYKVIPAFGICMADRLGMSISLMRDYATMALNTIKGKFYAKYAFFDDKMRKQMLLNKMIEGDIVDALKNDQLALFIQPKVDMLTCEIIGGEALVRWIHPERGVVSPNEFIPVLENNGLIIDVDLYIWTKVFKFMGNRLKEGKNVVPVSINISRLHIFDKEFKDSIMRLSSEYNVPPKYVILELTESGFLSNSDKMYQSLIELKEQGFVISMDDFGTGYSTMTMLKNQPVDEIKIDKGLIDNIDNDKSRSIVRHTINMLKELDMSVVVEGVEEKIQQEFLLECGCSSAQGYLYYRPIPYDDFEQLLDNKI